MKKNDIILVIVLISVAIIFTFVIQIFIKKDGNTAIVSIDGEVYKTLDLNVDTEITIQDVGGFNIITIEEGHAYMKDADCPDKICVHQGEISKVGETIVCLPHRVVIEINGVKSELDGVVQ